MDDEPHEIAVHDSMVADVRQGREIPKDASVLVPPPAMAVVQVVDRLGDIVGVVVVGWLASRHIVDGVFACGTILAILGVQSGFRQLGRKITANGVAAGLGGLALVIGLLAHGVSERTG